MKTKKKKQTTEQQKLEQIKTRTKGTKTKQNFARRSEYLELKM